MASQQSWLLLRYLPNPISMDLRHPAKLLSRPRGPDRHLKTVAHSNFDGFAIGGVVFHGSAKRRAPWLFAPRNIWWANDSTSPRSVLPARAASWRAFCCPVNCGTGIGTGAANYGRPFSNTELRVPEKLTSVLTILAFADCKIGLACPANLRCFPPSIHLGRVDESRLEAEGSGSSERLYGYSLSSIQVGA